MMTSKTKPTFTYTIKHWFTHHPWLKIIALLLAIMIWAYVKGEVKRF